MYVNVNVNVQVAINDIETVSYVSAWKHDVHQTGTIKCLLANRPVQNSDQVEVKTVRNTINP